MRDREMSPGRVAVFSRQGGEAVENDAGLLGASIRRANATDSNELADLARLADGDTLSFIARGISPMADVGAIYRDMLAELEGIYSYRNCLVAELDGNVIGMANAFTARLIENELAGARITASREAPARADRTKRSAELSSKQHRDNAGLSEMRNRHSSGGSCGRGGVGTEVFFDNASCLGRQHQGHRVLPKAWFQNGWPRRYPLASRTPAFRWKPLIEVANRMPMPRANIATRDEDNHSKQVLRDR